MKCPKCKKAMGEFYESNGIMQIRGKSFYVCSNKKCMFYGIPRINTDEIQEAGE